MRLTLNKRARGNSAKGMKNEHELENGGPDANPRRQTDINTDGEGNQTNRGFKNIPIYSHVIRRAGEDGIIWLLHVPSAVILADIYY